jgi:uncharacterized protein
MTEPHMMYRSVSLTVGEGRTIVAPCIVPYNRAARVQDENGPPYDEMFAPGCFERSLRAPHRILMRGQHGMDFLSIAGRVATLSDTDEQLAGEFLALESPSGDQALAMVRAGIYTGASVGIIPLRSRREGNVLVRTRAHLDHVALVMEAAYADAGTLAIRSAAADRFADLRPKPDPDLEERLTALRCPD